MYKILILTMLNNLKCFLINADDHIKSNFFTQFEPDSFKKSYTTITNKMADFKKIVGLMLRYLIFLLYPLQQV